jgi:hypothetical protein
MERVKEEVASIPVERLRTSVILIARKLAKNEQAEFLSILGQDAIDDLDQSRSSPPDDSLLDEITDFSRKAKSGELCTGFGWDHEIQEERDFGDESWVEHIDEFLARACTSLTNGHYEIARDSYAAIFAILDSARDGGQLPGPPDPEELLETAMDEARLRHIRAVYLATSEPDRPRAIADAFRRNGHLIGETYNLTCVRDAGERDLPTFKEFLTDWLTFLERSEVGSKPYDSWMNGRKYLLREAVILVRGTKGIADLARSRGDSQPRAYIEWIKQLEKNNDTEGLIIAAKEGLMSIPVDLVERAEVGEQLTKAGNATGNLELQLEGKRAAFESEPSITRLASLVDVAWQSGVYDKELKHVVDRLRELLDPKHSSEVTRKSNEDSHYTQGSPLILCQALFISGLYVDALEFAEKERVKATWYSEDITEFAVSFILRVLERGRGTEERNPNTTNLWKKVVTGSRWGIFYPNPGISTVEQMYDRTMQSATLTPDIEHRSLDWCVKAVSNRVDTIVGNKDRDRYSAVARMLCALVEIFEFRGEPGQASNLLDGFKRKYAHYSAFVQELRKARGDARPAVK